MPVGISTIDIFNARLKPRKWLSTNEGIIFTWDDEDGAEGIDIKVIPVWQWLLV